MLPNRASDQPASLLCSTHAHFTHKLELPAGPCLCYSGVFVLAALPAACCVGLHCCECDAQRAAALANSRDWLCERLPCHLGGPV